MRCSALDTFPARPLLALICAVLSTTNGRAQPQGALLRVDVPFAFESNTHHFRAGTYYVRVEQQRLTLSSSEERFVTTVLPDDRLDPALKNTVVFRRYGDRYFLREVWIAGHRTHVHCIPSPAEKQVQEAMADAHATAVTVALLDTSN